MSSISPLSLADLEAYDPQALCPTGAGERRFLCPLCGDDKPKNAEHRCFCLNHSNGLYHCKRCNCKGCLKEHWTATPKQPPNTVRAQKLHRAFEVRPVEVISSLSDTGAPNTDPHLIWNAAVPLSGTRAEGYLRQRGLTLQAAAWSNVRFVRDWYGRECVVFPFGNEREELVAVSGRALGDGGLDKPANGSKKHGAFRALWRQFGPFHPDAPILVCEAPLDALSLAQCGFAALALGGTSAPAWLAPRVAFRRVVLALDADGAGDEASAKLALHFAGYGARSVRLRPEGAKDWNAWLQSGASELRDFLEERLMNDILFE